MAMNIYDVLRPYHRLTKYDGIVGIEIETETIAPYDHLLMKYWTSVADGSLRHFGVEYVLQQPLNPGKDLDAALEEFRTKTEKFNFIQDSVSTSVHVHVNFLNETFLTLVNFLTVYSLMENLLIRFSGPDRLSNLFCLPICDAEDTVENILTLLYTLNDKGSFRGINILQQDRMKYSAINLASLATRGSLESRSMRGVTDTTLIRDWVMVLYNMLEYARRDITPLDVIAQWKNSGIEMLEDVFGDKFRLLSFDDGTKLVERNLWYAARIATFTNDWSKFAQFEPKAAKKSKTALRVERDEIALQTFGDVYNALTEAQKLVVVEVLERQVQAVQEDVAAGPFELHPNRLRPVFEVDVNEANDEFINARQILNQFAQQRVVAGGINDLWVNENARFVEPNDGELRDEFEPEFEPEFEDDFIPDEEDE